MRHRDKVVLAADTADDAAVGQAVGDGRPQQRHHHGGIQKPPMPTLRNFQCLIGTIELIDEGDAAHRKLAQFGLRHIAQRGVKSTRSQDKRAVQQSTAAKLPPGAQGQQVAAAIGRVQRSRGNLSF